VLNLGSGNQIGDVSTGDIAGRDINRVEITQDNSITVGNISSDSVTIGNEVLRSLQTDDPSLRQAVQTINEVISTGSINSATSVTIGHTIRQVVQHFNLPSEAVAALFDLRTQLSASLSLDTAHYTWSNLVADKLQGFVGREYVFAEIERFLSSRPNGYFLIEGDPGIGKSTLLAEYVRRTGCLAYFNHRSLGISSTTQFLQHLCAQIIIDAQLPYTHLPPEATRDGAFLVRLLREAAARLTPGERLVIAIDALDEVDLAGAAPGANILCLPGHLPNNVYFILTRRRVDLPLFISTPQQALNLMFHQLENRDDVERYLREAVQRPALQAWIVTQGLSADDFVALLAERSENNFMYLRLVLPEIAQGAYTSLSATMLPRGLEQYYDDHWVRMGMMTAPLPRAKIFMIYIICEARQPVSSSLIAYVARHAKLAMDELDIQAMLLDWLQFLHEQKVAMGTRYSIYHTSFRDFLHRKDIVQKAGVTIPGINALIAESLLRELYGDPD
ncbi:ATP-binding protein, partial [Oscillochloris sp. ZM17-4]|uniref:ATP-binding protein n=1 Tax=Oscillochloris sp. ZM17-4 TaxID=2866714 RepID=UPI001C7340F7